MHSKKPILRREKSDPCADYWHTMRVGLAAALILFIVLTKVMP